MGTVATFAACLSLLGGTARAGTAAVRVPLCPKLAVQSYSNPAMPEAVVNKYAAAQAQAKKLTITPLSSFVAEVSGDKKKVKWFEENYIFMVCAFDSAQVPNDEQVYITCTQYARRWIDIVQSAKPEDLMLQETHFASVCAQ